MQRPPLIALIELGTAAILVVILLYYPVLSLADDVHLEKERAAAMEAQRRAEQEQAQDRAEEHGCVREPVGGLQVGKVQSPRVGESGRIRTVEEVTLDRGGYKVAIFGDGRVVYRGRFYGIEVARALPVKTEGTRTKTLGADALRRLKREIERIDYFGLRGHCACPDAGSVRTSVRADGRFKAIRNYSDCGQTREALEDFEDFIDRIAGTAKWVGAYDERVRIQEMRDRRSAQGLAIPSARFEREQTGDDVVEVYTSQARTGNCPAAKRLGEIYAKGIRGVPADKGKSLRWFKEAHSMGCH